MRLNSPMQRGPGSPDPHLPLQFLRASSSSPNKAPGSPMGRSASRKNSPKPPSSPLIKTAASMSRSPPKSPLAGANRNRELIQSPDFKRTEDRLREELKVWSLGGHMILAGF